MQGGRESESEALGGGDRRVAGAPAPGLEHAPLPARTADGPGVHEGGAGEAVRADLARHRRLSLRERSSFRGAKGDDRGFRAVFRYLPCRLRWLFIRSLAHRIVE